MAKRQQDDAQSSWDVYISGGERETDVASQFRTDFPRVKLSVHPATVFHPGHMTQVRCVVVLQSRRKPDDVVRATIAAAQHPDIDLPIVTVFVRDGQIAVRRVGSEQIYLPYEDGLPQVVFDIWRAFDADHVALENAMPAENSFQWLVNTLNS